MCNAFMLVASLLAFIELSDEIHKSYKNEMNNNTEETINE